MRNMENEWIALGFGEGPRSICRVMRMTNMILTYRPEKKGGELQIEGTEVVWHYSVADVMAEWED